MPRHGGGQRGSRDRFLRLTALFLCLPAMAVVLPSDPAAAVVTLPTGRMGQVPLREIVLLVCLAGTLGFALACAISLIRSRRMLAEKVETLQDEILDLRLSLEQAESLLTIGDQRMIIYDPNAPHPIVTGHLSPRSGAPASPAAFLAFEGWLPADEALKLERCIANLRHNAAAFTETLATNSKTFIETAGSVAGALVCVRFRSLTGERAALARLQDDHEALMRQTEAARDLLTQLKSPAWIRDEQGRIEWVNDAYVTTVGADDLAAVLEDQTELLDNAARRAVEAAATDDGFASLQRQVVVVAGERYVMDVNEVATEDGSIGLALDVSELDQVRNTLDRTVDYHAQTLDQLTTAVASFGADRRLRFFNQAYRSLWGLDTALLESSPEDGTILDHLRAARKLPEQADFRKWKASLMECYRSVEPSEAWWHLPDSQTLRVVVNPHPQGGVTYFYENVTEKLELESRFNALNRVQRETLDHLSDAVAVFGSDGRLRLWNPAFTQLWKLAESRAKQQPHVSEIIEWCSLLHEDPEVWRSLSASVTAIGQNREPFSGRMERADGAVVDFAVEPLPDGSTLATFVNVTDTVRMERALMDKNEALEAADRLKNAFIQHVSYELRSPLTNIIGFSELLSEPKIGALNAKQSEYAELIRTSSSALLAIINDILDLATVDAGIMELDLQEVEIADTLAAAIEGVQDRLTETKIELVTNIPTDAGAFIADGRRVRQILFNLLSNAIAYSKEGDPVELDCERTSDSVVFTVTDHGSGIPDEVIASVFDRFVAHGAGLHRHGAGLGLSIVKSFVELHGGTVTIASTHGSGTSVTCRFPARPRPFAVAAAE